MREVNMMPGLHLKMDRDKCPLPINDPNKTDFKVGDMVLLKNHPPTTAFDSQIQAKL